MRRIAKITGRSDDMVIVRGVNVFPTQIEELILRSDALTAHYQLILTREGRMDEMAVQVEARPEAWYRGAEEESATLAHHIKSLIGVTAKVTVVAPGSIERSLGKAKRVIDNRPKA
jgi:phenylacetate-CoA ligase